MVKIRWDQSGILNHVDSQQAAGVSLGLFVVFFLMCCCAYIGSDIADHYIRYALQFFPFQPLSWAFIGHPPTKPG